MPVGFIKDEILIFRLAYASSLGFVYDLNQFLITTPFSYSVQYARQKE